MAAYTAEEILKQLDEHARRFTFPVLDNGYIYLADTRLTAYRDDVRWALVIEVLGCGTGVVGHQRIADSLYCFGNCLPHEPGLTNESFIYPTAGGPDGPTFDEEYGWFVRAHVSSIRARGQSVPVRVDRVALSARGIPLAVPPHIAAADLLRSLVPEHRDLLLATEAEIRQHIPADLPRILLLDAWHHPDIARGELPSGSLTFQMVADVLVSGDPARYRPAIEPNTHWRNWPESGTL